MRKLKIAYAYLFFFIYNSVNKKDNILVQPKTLFLVILIELMVVMSTVIQYGNITKTTVIPENFNRLNLLFIIMPLIALNFWFFERNKNWKKYLEEFKAWPIEKQKKWNWFMRVILIFVSANLIFSFYWLSQINWKLYD